MIQPNAPHGIRPAKPLTPEDLRGDLIKSDHPLFGIIWINPERLSGAPCFSGTRVPVKALFDCLEGGGSLEDFLDGFAPVTRDQAIAVLEISQRKLLEETLAS